jgi:hypothetical protein
MRRHFGRARFFRGRNCGKQMAIFKNGYVQVVMTVQVVMAVDVSIDEI